jgi:nicotinamidase-related amidase
VLPKLKPSAFHGTPLRAHLNLLGADSLIIGGTTTSGCVRASVIDAFSENYRVTLAEECCFDRAQSSHAINLMDMQAKYADVRPTAEVVAFVEKLPDDCSRCRATQPRGARATGASALSPRRTSA